MSVVYLCVSAKVCLLRSCFVKACPMCTIIRKHYKILWVLNIDLNKMSFYFSFLLSQNLFVLGPIRLHFVFHVLCFQSSYQNMRTTEEKYKILNYWNDDGGTAERMNERMKAITIVFHSFVISLSTKN